MEPLLVFKQQNDRDICGGGLKSISLLSVNNQIVACLKLRRLMTMEPAGSIRSNAMKKIMFQNTETGKSDMTYESRFERGASFPAFYTLFFL